MGNFISQLIKFLNIVRNILFCDLELLESNRSIALGVIDNIIIISPYYVS